MMEWTGILAIEGEQTGDGRLIEKGALVWDDGPWPLKFRVDESIHDAPVVGTIDRIWRDGPNIRGEGLLHVDSDNELVKANARRAQELLTADDGPVVGVSVELDSEAVELRVDKAAWDQWQQDMDDMLTGEAPEDPEVKDGRVVVERVAFDDWLEVVTSARLRAAAIVDTAAFADAEIIAAQISIAASVAPSAFSNPQFGPDGELDDRLVWQSPQRSEESGGWGCPLTVTKDGRVYGHAALNFRCHGAYEQCLTPQALGASLSQWLIGDATGTGIPTGPIIVDTTHGVTDNGKIKSHDHLAHTGMAAADVTAGVDAHGVWVAGQIRPGATEGQVAALRGSALSLEWHRIGSKLQVVGCLAVNSPGYLIQRRGVAASFTTGAVCCEERTAEERIETLEALVASLIGSEVRHG